MARPHPVTAWRGTGAWRTGRAWRTGSLVAATVGVALVATGLSRRRRAGAESPAGRRAPGPSPRLRSASAGPAPAPPGVAGLSAPVVTPDTGGEGPSAPPVSLHGDSATDRQRHSTQPGPADPAAVAGVGGGDDGPAPRHTRAGGPRRWPAVTAGVVVLAAAVAGAIVVRDRDGGPSAATSGTAAPPEPSTTTSVAVAALAPEKAVELAGRRLGAAGSFTYRGTVSATDVSAVRPGPWLAVDATIDGEVDLSSGRLHEVAVADDGRATETVVDGSTVWGRSASSREALATVPYQVVPPGGDPGAPRGVALLARWLSATTDHHDVEDGPYGQRRVAATIPADVLGEVERGREPVAGRIVLTLGPAGDPVAVEVTTVPEGPRLRLTIGLAALGEPVAIEPPAG